jgi:hypothetical protein
MLISSEILEELIDDGDGLNLSFNEPKSYKNVIELLYQVDQFQKTIESQARKLLENDNSDLKLRNISLKEHMMQRGVYVQPYSGIKVFKVTFGKYVWDYDCRCYDWKNTDVIIPFDLLLSENIKEDVCNFNTSRQNAYDNWFNKKIEDDKKREEEHKLYLQNQKKEKEKENFLKREEKDKAEYERLKKKFEGHDT